MEYAQAGLSEIGGCSIQDLAKEFGTPLWIHNLDAMLQRCQGLRQFDDVYVAVSQVGQVAILEGLKRHGIKAFINSPAEFATAVAAGFAPGRDLAHAADHFDAESLNQVVQHHLPAHVGSPNMVNQLGERAPGRDVTLRIHSELAASSFGVSFDEIVDCLRRADQNGLTVTGLEVQICPNASSGQTQQAGELLVAAAQEVGRTVQSICISGGVLSKSHPTAEDPVAENPLTQGDEAAAASEFETWDHRRKQLQERFGHQVRLTIEASHFLLRANNYLLCEVQTIKERGGESVLLTNANFHSLAEWASHETLASIAVCHRAGRQSTGQQRSRVAGLSAQSCGELPRSKVGDWLILQTPSGDKASPASSASLVDPRVLPAVVMIENGQGKLIITTAEQDQGEE